MTTPELAKASIKFAEALGLTLDNRQEFALEIMKLSLFGDSPLEGARRVAQEETVATEPARSVVKTPKKAHKRRERSEATPPQQVNKPSKLLCRANTKCNCSECGKDVFTVLSDIYDGLKAEEFAAKFLPIDHGKLLPTPMRLRAVDGCVMTDCPVCGGDMTLVLWGKRPENDFEDSGIRTGEV